MLQAAVAGCLKETVTDNTYARILNTLNGSYVYCNRYITQYIDLLNHKFIGMTSEKRLIYLSIMTKRIAEKGQEYRDLEDDIRNEARRSGCDVDELRLALDFPDINLYQ